ncbi:N-acetylmuramoyl-L-alanine amidase [Nakamurella aerolata]|uniref:N-acetylmuramoyl-L-alanine amidase n=1 Tax=Nakamurella aerolata TaxID=1656892 RepID=UPI001BB25496|nr:N-acetylmuramoyl-L-alanine amidase [Nakamurella aerolata]
MTKKVVVIDPGHNGANQFNPDIIKQQVPAGNGTTKDCNTTGTQTAGGYPEYTFNWNVANRLKDQLQAKGITVVMTRDSNDGVGPCVDKRAQIGNDANPAAVISIHGDSTENQQGNGFYSSLAEGAPGGAKVAGQSLRLARDLNAAISASGVMSTADYIGENGILTRSDLAGLNLSTVPTVLLELGNMSNATDARIMTSEANQSALADAIAKGTIKYLIGQ